jgi:hypothetical protein
MGYPNECDCGHTLEYHLNDVTFERCPWSRACAAALNAVLLDGLGADGSVIKPRKTFALASRRTSTGAMLSLVISRA